MIGPLVGYADVLYLYMMLIKVDSA